MFHAELLILLRVIAHFVYVQVGSLQWYFHVWIGPNLIMVESANCCNLQGILVSDVVESRSIS